MGDLHEAENRALPLDPLLVIFQERNTLRPAEDVAMTFQSALALKAAIQRHDLCSLVVLSNQISGIGHPTQNAVHVQVAYVK